MQPSRSASSDDDIANEVLDVFLKAFANEVLARASRLSPVDIARGVGAVQPSWRELADQQPRSARAKRLKVVKSGRPGTGGA